MSRLDDISLEKIQELREQTEEEIPRERVLAAIGRKQGDGLDRLAERHGVVEKTIRNWLDRFAREPIERAPYDDDRPGRPSKLDEERREQLFEQLQRPPTELGYEQQAWSSTLLINHVKEEYGVEYSRGRARKLMSKAELSYRTARPRNHEADPEKEAEFEETVEKKARTDRKNRCCRRSVYQARRHSSTMRLVPDRFKSDNKDLKLVG